MSARLGFVELAATIRRGDYRTAWADLVRALPPCSECGAPSAWIHRDYPQDPPSYRCSRNECQALDCGSDCEGLKRAPWSEHVLAWEMGGRMKP